MSLYRLQKQAIALSRITQKSIIGGKEVYWCTADEYVKVSWYFYFFVFSRLRKKKIELNVTDLNNVMRKVLVISLLSSHQF